MSERATPETCLLKIEDCDSKLIAAVRQLMTEKALPLGNLPVCDELHRRGVINLDRQARLYPSHWQRKAVADAVSALYQAGELRDEHIAAGAAG